MSYEHNQAYLSDFVLYLSRITPEDLENNTVIEISERYFLMQEKQAKLDMEMTLDLFTIEEK